MSFLLFLLFALPGVEAVAHPGGGQSSYLFVAVLPPSVAAYFYLKAELLCICAIPWISR
jgi:hypothetical protein